MSVPGRPHFDLVDHDGRPVTIDSYAGQYLLVFFGFTNCAMVCPRALARLTGVLDRLGRGAELIRPLYITVDPERDTPAVMKEFLARTAPAFTGLTGTQERVDAAKEAFHVFARRKADPSAPDGYSMPHTAFTYAVDPRGAFAAHFGDAVPDVEVYESLHELLTTAGSTG
ncbi:MAG: SCO family protein [Mycobacterium sp.]|nr:SCO family protein [Mycobacterium sp.]